VLEEELPLLELGDIEAGVVVGRRAGAVDGGGGVGPGVLAVAADVHGQEVDVVDADGVEVVQRPDDGAPVVGVGCVGRIPVGVARAPVGGVGGELVQARGRARAGAEVGGVVETDVPEPVLGRVGTGFDEAGSVGEGEVVGAVVREASVRGEARGARVERGDGERVGLPVEIGRCPGGGVGCFVGQDRDGDVWSGAEARGRGPRPWFVGVEPDAPDISGVAAGAVAGEVPRDAVGLPRRSGERDLEAVVEEGVGCCELRGRGPGVVDGEGLALHERAGDGAGGCESGGDERESRGRAGDGVHGLPFLRAGGGGGVLECSVRQPEDGSERFCGDWRCVRARPVCQGLPSS
jgi:hypothetical protein